MKLIARLNRSCAAWVLAAVALILVASAADAARLPTFPKRTPELNADEHHGPKYHQRSSLHRERV
jgi:hypothetical protein